MDLDWFQEVVVNRCATMRPSQRRAGPSAETSPKRRVASWHLTVSTSSILAPYRVISLFQLIFGFICGNWVILVTCSSVISPVFHLKCLHFQRKWSRKLRWITMKLNCSGCGDMYGDPTSLAALLMHRFRNPLRYYVDHQRVPLFGHDLFLFQDRNHRKRTQHYRRIWSLPILAWISVWIAVRQSLPRFDS